MTRSPLLRLTFCLVAVAGCRSRPESSSSPYASEVAEDIPRIEAAVGLKYKTQPKIEERSKDQVRKFLEDKFNEAQPASELAGQQSALRVLGLIPDTMQLRPFLLDLLTEQIVGYYDPRTKVLYVVKGADSTMAAMTVAHELVHALQDQYVNIDSIQHVEGQSDRTAAAQAALEGQATHVQLQAGGLVSRTSGAWD
ncbi:MAG: hypothetical protein ACJ79K_09330, partial [Gemmatimonadaceae bacterium]